MPVFVPPVALDLPAILPESRGVQRRLFKYFGPYERGLSVLRIGGAYRTVDTPDQLTLATATETYLGGHLYVVSQAIADALTTGGYGAYIATEPFDPTHTWTGAAGRTWAESAGYQWQEL